MSDNRVIRQAVPSDIPAILSFLATARYIHRHLDWRTTTDWVGFHPFTLLEESNRLTSLLTLPQDPAGIAWIRCFAVAPMASLSKSWVELFAASLLAEDAQRPIICSIGLQDWFTRLLLANHFTHFQDIIILEWNHTIPAPRTLLPSFELRSMIEEDIQEVAGVDQKAFEALWVNSAETLRLAYRQSDFAEVIEYQGKIVGYQISTANQFSAHLARLAVHPDFQKHGLGFALVNSIFQHYTEMNIFQITVNTQQNNHSSLTLYQKMGFEVTGEHYPILVYNR